MLQESDPEVFDIIQKEETRQQEKLSMIPSENFFSPAVREAVGSVFSHKYAEGNIGKRYYEGNEHVDELEALAIKRAKDVFHLPEDWDVNVQALSGANANLAVYLALLEFGDTMMAMYLPDGGHLSHGWSFEPDEQKRASQADDLVYLGGSRRVNITSKMFKVVQYKTDPQTRLFDYDEIAKMAARYTPKILITGGTAYPRDLDHERMRAIADSVGAYYLADVAHEAGLVAARVLRSPVGVADVVTMTTHKTLRAGRGAIILSRGDLIDEINRAILPGLQGGPHNHNIAGICVGLGEALLPEFAVYAKQVVENCQQLAAHLHTLGFNVVSGGTDKHLLLLDLTDSPLLGRKFARALNQAGIVVNYSTMPQETRSPADPSAIRLGTPWITTRGMGIDEMRRIADWVAQVMTISSDWADVDFEEFNRRAAASPELREVATQVAQLCEAFPLEFRASEPARTM